jgi:hypothetical protein
MNHLEILLLSLLAFGALALAMDRHQRNLFGRRLASGATRCLRWGGWGTLALALLIAVRSQGWILGLVSYSGHASLAAGLVYVALIATERRKIL